MKKILSKYARRFNENTSPMWVTNDQSTNRMCLKYYENYFNNLLKVRGYVFLRDIYEIFGFKVSEESILVGWYYDKDNPIGDNRIEFDIVEGEDYFDIDFNVDGNISNKF